MFINYDVVRIREYNLSPYQSCLDFFLVSSKRNTQSRFIGYKARDKCRITLTVKLESFIMFSRSILRFTTTAYKTVTVTTVLDFRSRTFRYHEERNCRYARYCVSLILTIRKCGHKWKCENRQNVDCKVTHVTWKTRIYISLSLSFSLSFSFYDIYEKSASKSHCRSSGGLWSSRLLCMTNDKPELRATFVSLCD